MLRVAFALCLTTACCSQEPASPDAPPPAATAPAAGVATTVTLAITGMH